MSIFLLSVLSILLLGSAKLDRQNGGQMGRQHRKSLESNKHWIERMNSTSFTFSSLLQWLWGTLESEIVLFYLWDKFFPITMRAILGTAWKSSPSWEEDFRWADHSIFRLSRNFNFNWYFAEDSHCLWT